MSLCMRVEAIIPVHGFSVAGVFSFHPVSWISTLQP